MGAPDSKPFGYRVDTMALCIFVTAKVDGSHGLLRRLLCLEAGMLIVTVGNVF